MTAQWNICIEFEGVRELTPPDGFAPSRFRNAFGHINFRCVGAASSENSGRPSPQRHGRHNEGELVGQPLSDETAGEVDSAVGDDRLALLGIQFRDFSRPITAGTRIPSARSHL